MFSLHMLQGWSKSKLADLVLFLGQAVFESSVSLLPAETKTSINSNSINYSNVLPILETIHNLVTICLVISLMNSLGWPSYLREF